MKVGLKLLIQPYCEEKYQGEDEKDLFGAHDWYEWEFLVQVMDDLKFLVQIQLEQECQSEQVLVKKGQQKVHTSEGWIREA